MLAISRCGSRSSCARTRRSSRVVGKRSNSRITRQVSRSILLPSRPAPGRTDLVTSGTKRASISNGHEYMAQVTGIGCAETALVAALAARSRTTSFWRRRRPLDHRCCGRSCSGARTRAGKLRAGADRHDRGVRRGDHGAAGEARMNVNFTLYVLVDPARAKGRPLADVADGSCARWCDAHSAARQERSDPDARRASDRNQALARRQ